MKKVSPYSFYAFTYLQKNAATLESLGVEIEYVTVLLLCYLLSRVPTNFPRRYIPVFLGGINVASGTSCLPLYTYTYNLSLAFFFIFAPFFPVGMTSKESILKKRK